MTAPQQDNHLIESDSETDTDDGYETDDESDSDDPIMSLNLTPDEMRRYAQWLCDLEYAIFCHFQKE
jgi:hypothetical protein